MTKLKPELARIALSFLRAFLAGATLGQIPSDMRGAQAVLVGAMIAGGAAALRTVEAVLARIAGPDPDGGI
jgi:uracil phosphoribosyltransferase